MRIRQLIAAQVLFHEGLLVGVVVYFRESTSLNVLQVWKTVILDTAPFSRLILLIIGGVVLLNVVAENTNGLFHLGKADFECLL